MADRSRPSFLSKLLSRLRGEPRAAQQPKTQMRPFQAIAIYRGVICCEMARKFGEHRFLAKDAPPLPLQGCTMPERCECKYLKYKDRRAEARRLVDFGMSTRVFDGKERRARVGRRSTD